MVQPTIPHPLGNNVLVKELYKGLEDQNTGFDSREIFWFNEQDFGEILKRSDKLGYGMFGIESYRINEGDFFETEVYEDYDKHPAWYWGAFAKLRDEDNKSPKLYSGIFYEIL